MEEAHKVKGNAMTATLRPDGIVEVLNDKDWDEPDTLELIKENTSIIKKMIGGHPNRCLLIEVPNRHTSKEILNHYQQVDTGAVARGLLLNSFATKVMGNLYLKLSKGKPNETGRIVPVRLFTNKEEAIKWLLGRMKNK
jgi:hypothetical protein